MTAPRPIPQPPHDGYIDALRGWAFLAVFVVHAHELVPGLPQPLQDILGRGYAGVQLFYVVSALTLCRSLVARAHEPAPLRAYFLRRLFRIVPMFWVAIALFTAFYGLGSAAPRWGAPDGLSVGHIVLAATLLHGFSLPALDGVVPGAWSVATEVQFYLVLPLLLRRASSLRRACGMWVLMLLVSAVSMPLFDHLLVPLYSAYQQVAAHQFGYYALPTQLPVFGAGLILFRLLGPDRSALAHLERWLPARPRARSLLVVLIVLAIGLPLSLSAWPRLIPTFPGHLGYGVLAAGLTYALASYPLALLVNPLTRFFGRISYSAYLLHFAALFAVEPWIAPVLVGRPLLHLVVGGGLALALITAASVLTYALVEQPGIALGRRVIARLARPGAALSPAV